MDGYELMASQIKMKLKSELKRLETPIQSREAASRMHDLVGYSATAETRK